MTYNMNLVNQTRSAKDSAKKQEYRRGKFENLAKIKLRDLTNGTFPLRLWPCHPDDNPHGFLDYREHNVPQKYPVAGRDPDIVRMQCPRSSNWDPIPGPDGEFAVRCACCELDDWVFETPSDPNDPDSPVLIDILPEGITEIIGKMDYRGSMMSGIFIPGTLRAKVDTHTKETGRNGKVYDNYTYKPGGTEDFLSVLLCLNFPDFSEKFDENGLPLPARNGFSEQFFNFLKQCPDASDLQFGRWINITKINDGKGAGGYSLLPDSYPSVFPADKMEYKKLYSFPKWGDKTRKKASIRLPYEQQIAILANTEWAEDFRKYNIPMTDADVDQLGRGLPLIPNTSMVLPGQVPFPLTGNPSVPAGPTMGYAPTPYAQPGATTQAPYQPPAPAGYTGSPTTSPFNQQPMGNGHTHVPSPAYGVPPQNPGYSPQFLNTQAMPQGFSYPPTPTPMTSPFNQGYGQ